MKVDVIIPIYNAYEYVVKCIESVLSNSKKEEYNLILINDNSSDVRVNDYLQDLQGKNLDNIYIYINDKNIGFIHSVNKGMSMSENDVILLNSDTEVTKNWIRKLKTSAYLKDNIATVTPLTNNGTICSIPNYCQDNELPNNLSIDEFAEIVEKISLKLYPEIPTAVGFCMYIKREVLNKIGLFDAKLFGKGYGEENEFCCRALDRGYIHVLCDDTFIYHKGSSSFLKEKDKRITRNSEILRNKYPYYFPMVDKFVKDYSIKPIIDNIKLQLKSSKKNILFLLHNDFIHGENHSIGGTEYHTKDIIDNIKSVNFFVMYVRGASIKLQSFENDDVKTYEYRLDKPISPYTFSRSDYKKQVEKIIEYFSIDIIHVQHFINHTFDIIEIAKAKNIPIYLTLHDYYLVCPKINLLDKNNTYCKYTRNKDMCRSCMRRLLNNNVNLLTSWNQKIYNCLKEFDKVFAPSNSVVEIVNEYYKSLYGDFNVNIEVIEHGVSENNVRNEKINSLNEPFRVAFIGSVTQHKGSEIIYNTIRKYISNNTSRPLSGMSGAVKNSSNKIEWHIFGNIYDNRLNELRNRFVIKHGPYQRDSIINKLIDNNIDLVCIMSIWPETYSYTFSEAIIANIPILTTDIGALGERMKRYECGWTVPYNTDPKEILELILNISTDKEEYLNKYYKIKEIKLENKEVVCKKYEQIYISSINKKSNT